MTYAAEQHSTVVTVVSFNLYRTRTSNSNVSSKESQIKAIHNSRVVFFGKMGDTPEL